MPPVEPATNTRAFLGTDTYMFGGVLNAHPANSLPVQMKEQLAGASPWRSGQSTVTTVKCTTFGHETPNPL